MKKYYLFAGLVLLAASPAFAQVKIGAAGVPDGSAMLEVTSGATNNKGLLLPRMTTVQRNAITNPATGLMIYNTTANEVQVNTGTPAAPTWVTATATATGWDLTGNTGTNPATNFIGTSDNQPMVVRTNNTEKVRVTAAGDVGIGTAAPVVKLHVVDTGDATIRIGSGANGGGHIQLGNDNHGLMRDLTSSGGGANDVAVYTSSGGPAANLYLVANPVASGSGNLPLDQFVLTTAGNVGIGTKTPAAKLHVDTGGLRISNGSTALPDPAIEVINDGGGPGTNDNIVISSYGTNTQPSIGTQSARGTASAPQNSQPGDNIGNFFFNSRVNGAIANSNVIRGVYLGDGTTNKSRLNIFTSNAMAMTIDSNQNVGINTVSPQQPLHVAGAARITGSAGTATTIAGRNAAGDVSNVTVGAGLSLTGGTLTATAATNDWDLTGNAGTNPATNFIGTSDNQPIVVRTNNTEKVRVTAAGDVGIGTNAPASKLQVEDGSLIISNSAPTTRSAASFINDGGGSGLVDDVDIFSYGTATVPAYGMWTARGTAAAPANAQTGDVAGALRFGTRVNGANAEINRIQSAYVGNGTTLKARLTFISNGVTAMSIDSSGDVGIGVLTPLQTLHVAGTARITTATGTPTTITGRNASGDIGNVTVGTGLTLTAGTLSVTGGTNDWDLTGNTGTNPATNFIGTSDNQPIVVRTNNTEKVRVTAVGDVGIGTTAPVVKLHVVDTGDATIRIGSGANGGSRGHIQLGNDNHGLMRDLTSSGGGANDVAVYTSSGGPAANLHLVANPIASGSDSLPLDQFVLTTAGNVGIGTNTPAQTLHVAGNARIAAATGTPTTITGRNAAGDIGNVTVGTGLTLTGGTLSVTGGTNDWDLTGNAGTNPATNFIGTSDNQPIVVRTNNTEKVRVTADGDMGIGTGAPAQTLHVAGTARISTAAGTPTTITGRNAAGDVGNVTVGTGLTLTAGTLSVTGGTNDWDLTGNAGTNPATNFIGTSDNQPLVFRTNSTEKVRLTTAGYVGIGFANPNAKLHVNGGVMVSRDSNLTYGNGGMTLWSSVRSGIGEMEFINFHGTGSGGFRFYDVDPDPIVGTADTGSWIAYIQPGTGTYHTPSDGRVKTNVNVINEGLAKVMAMRPVSYDLHTGRELKDGVATFTKNDKTISTIGFIAQELVKIVPEAVNVPSDPNTELYSVSYTTVIPVLTKAIQEQQQIIESLKAELAAVKTDNAALKADAWKIAELAEKMKQLEAVLGTTTGNITAAK